MINSIGARDSLQIQFRMELVASKSSQPKMREAQTEVAPPRGKGLFADLDTDSSGGLSQSEFQRLADGISQVAGSSVDAASVYTTYDKDGNGVLSGEELHQAMTGMGVEPPPPPQTPGAVQDLSRKQTLAGGAADLVNQGTSESVREPLRGPNGATNRAASQNQRYEELMAYVRQAGEKPDSLNVLT